MTLEKCIELLVTRRSVRRFKDQEVPDELLLKAVDIARWAPSAHNYQPWEFIIIKDRGTLDKLAEIHRWSRPIKNATAAIVIVADKEKAKVTYQLDGAIVTTYLWLTLHALGLGAVWIETLKVADKVRAILNIPDSKEPIATLAIGWPAETPQARPREPVRRMIHYNIYGNKP
jgi:nitroreductase